MKMKKLIKAVALAVCLTMAVPVVAPSVGIETVEAATKVKLNCTKKSIYEGDSFKLKVTGTSKKVKWSSSNKKVATVSDKGNVKGIGEGTAKITATVSGKKYACKVTVKSNWNDINKAALGIILYKSKLKDPDSFKIYNATTGNTTIEYGDGSIYNVEMILIDCGSKNGYGGMVREYLSVEIFPKNGEPLRWITHKYIPQGKYLTCGTYSKNYVPTLENRKNLNTKDIIDAVNKLEEEYEYTIYNDSLF